MYLMLCTSAPHRHPVCLSYERSPQQLLIHSLYYYAVEFYFSAVWHITMDAFARLQGSCVNFTHLKRRRLAIPCSYEMRNSQHSKEGGKAAAQPWPWAYVHASLARGLPPSL